MPTIFFPLSEDLVINVTHVACVHLNRNGTSIFVLANGKEHQAGAKATEAFRREFGDHYEERGPDGR